jgi:hypothetical protein
MLYAVLCYNDEDITGSWTKEEDDRVMARLAAVTDGLAKAGKLGPVARLMPTTAATTLHKGGHGKRLEPGPEPAVVMDGPFAETKEQLLGFYVIECSGLEEALGIVRELGQANPGGAYEIRPVALFLPGGKVA